MKPFANSKKSFGIPQSNKTPAICQLRTVATWLMTSAGLFWLVCNYVRGTHGPHPPSALSHAFVTTFQKPLSEKIAADQAHVRRKLGIFYY